VFVCDLRIQNVPEGFFVTQVTAIDDDTGVNGEVRYELVRSPSSQIAWQKFRIDAKSGNITTAGAIDRETLETYYVRTDLLLHFIILSIWNNHMMTPGYV